MILNHKIMESRLIEFLTRLWRYKKQIALFIKNYYNFPVRIGMYVWKIVENQEILC